MCRTGRAVFVPMRYHWLVTDRTRRGASWLLTCTALLAACGAKSALDPRDVGEAGEGPGLRDSGTVGVDRPAGDASVPPAPDMFTPTPCEPMRSRPLSLPTRLAAAPALAFDGREYGILWADTVGFGGCGLAEWSFARLDRFGVRTGATVAVDPGSYDGTGTLHVIDGEFWAVIGGDEGLRAVRLAEDGAEGIELTTQPTDFHDAVVTESGGLAVVAVERGADSPVVVHVFDEVGGPEWSTVVSTAGGWATIEETRAGFAVAISEGYERVLTTTVTEGAPAPPLLELHENTSGSAFVSGHADVAPLETGSAVFFARADRLPRPMEMARLTEGSTLIDTRPVGDPGATLHPTVAIERRSGEIGVLWKHAPAGELSTELRFRTFDARGEALGPEQVAERDHRWAGCTNLDRMALVRSAAGWAFATAEPTDDGGSQISFGVICP